MSIILPTSINIKGFTYNVILTNDKNNLLVDDVLCMGRIDYRNQIIYISTEMCMEQQLQTFIHEVIHAIDFLVTKTDSNEQLTEVQTDNIAIGLTSIVLNNIKENK